MNRIEMIPVNSPLLEGNEKKYLSECIETGWISSEGPFVHKFENAMAQETGRKYASAVSSGTSALELAFAALDLEAGDEVIIPSFTIISCVSAIIRCNLVPIFVDSDLNTWNTNLEFIKKAYTNKTKAILLPHIYGLPIDLDPILDFAKEHNLFIVEDAAQMHGQSYKDRKCGSFGDISIFSFYANKLVSTGEGGMLLTNKQEIYLRVESLKNQAFIKGKRFYHEDLGFNFRMTNLQAAVGLAQVEQLEKFVLKKKLVGELYQEGLSSIKNIQLPVKQTPYATNIYWAFGLVLKGSLEGRAQEITTSLRGLGVDTRPFFYPLHKQPIIQKLGFAKNSVSLENAECLGDNGFYLPNGLGIDLKQVDKVCKSLRQILG